MTFSAYAAATRQALKTRYEAALKKYERYDHNKFIYTYL